MEFIDPFCIQTEQNIDLWLPKIQFEMYILFKNQHAESWI